MVSSVADILWGLWAKSSTTVISFAAPTATARLRGTQSFPPRLSVPDPSPQGCANKAAAHHLAAHSRGGGRSDCVAGVGGLELGNVGIVECGPNSLVCQNIFVPENFGEGPQRDGRGS